MLNKEQKEFWFKSQCREVLYRYTQMKMCSDSASDLDQSRLAAFERSEQKLIGMCIPYEYNVDIDYKKLQIRIYSYVNNRTYLVYTYGEAIGDIV